MKKRILIFGAGAIGRGYLAPLLQGYNAEISFVDINKQLIEKMKRQKKYRAAITTDSGYKFVEVPIKAAYYLDDKIDLVSYDVVFCCVGPNNCYDLAERFKQAKVVVSCENDSSTSIKLRELSGNPNIYFGIPDVITSNTASKELIAQDPLTTITEEGVLVLEAGNYDLPQEILQVNYEELMMHWMCKLFIHNAPHAIVAYLGWLKGYTYIHEAMADSDIEEIVVGSICEITEGVITAGFATKEFANMYKEKELKRFKNKFLYDTILRVAREPIRKMGKDNRLVLGLRIALFNGVLPKYTAIGARAALAYDNPQDKEAVYLQSLLKSVGVVEVLRKHSGIEDFDPLGTFIAHQDISKFRAKST